MSTDPNRPGGVLLDRMLSGFGMASGEPLQVQTQAKVRYGKGGLLDYLRTAQPVAPIILPDIIALDAAELEQAVAVGAIRPLDELIDAEVLDELYPAARALGRIGGRQYGVPFALDIEQVVYDPAVTSNVPETWTGLLAGNTRYLLPLSVPAVRTGPAAGVPPALLSHYLGAEYALDSEARQLELDSEPLLRILSFYDQAVEQGQLDERPEDVTGLQDAKPFYEAGTDAVIQASARQLMTDWEQHEHLAYAAAPGWSSPSPPIATGWVLAVVTPDPARQQRAAELLTWLLAPERNGRWTEATGWLPVSSAGWEFREESPYGDFLDEQLKAAAPLPVGADSAAAALALQQAVLAVVRDGVSPVDAARQALDSTQ
jgi:ABC-type glycerol-3-phosphate transport system substrate-binding protein